MDEDVLIMEKYIDGLLDESEKAAFEKRLLNDADLAGRFDIFKTMLQQEKFAAGFSAEEAAFKATLQQQHTAKKAPVKNINRKWYYAAAAVLVVCIAVGIKYFTADKGSDLYAAYAKHDALNIAERGNNDSVLIKGATLYNENKFDAALPLLQQYADKDPGNPSVALAIGICLLEKDRFAEAMPVFDSLANGKTVLQQDAVWYKAMLYLKQNKKDSCRQILHTIPAASGKYNEAKGLLQRLH